MTREELLPEHPILRQIAEVMEEARQAAEIFDTRWCSVFISTQRARLMGVDPADIARLFGLSPVERAEKYPDVWRAEKKSAARWWQKLGPVMVHDLAPDSPDFERAFGHAAERMRSVEPADPPPLAVTFQQVFRPTGGGIWAHDSGTATRLIVHRLHDPNGAFIGHLVTDDVDLHKELQIRLMLGGKDRFERLERLREPERRPAAILFADLVASGEHSRRLSSKAYFSPDPLPDRPDRRGGRE